MNDHIKKTTQVLEVLAANANKIIDFTVRLRNNLNLKDAKHYTHLKTYFDGWKYEEYVLADFVDERMLCWCFELGLEDDHWEIVTHVRFDEDESYIEFPDRIARTHDELLEQINLGFYDLINTYDEVIAKFGAV